MPIGIRVTDLPAAAGTLDDDDEFLTLEDGTLRRATRAQAGPKASIVQVTDTANQFTGTNVETVLAEIQDNVDALVISGGGMSVASEAEALAGTDNTKAMTPLRVHQTAVIAGAPNELTSFGTIIGNSEVTHAVGGQLGFEAGSKFRDPDNPITQAFAAHALFSGVPGATQGSYQGGSSQVTVYAESAYTDAALGFEGIVLMDGAGGSIPTAIGMSSTAMVKGTTTTTDLISMQASAPFAQGGTPAVTNAISLRIQEPTVGTNRYNVLSQGRHRIWKGTASNVLEVANASNLLQWASNGSTLVGYASDGTSSRVVLDPTDTATTRASLNASTNTTALLVLTHNGTPTANLLEVKLSTVNHFVVLSTGYPWARNGYQWGATGEQTTVGAAGGASAPPATPTKWLRVKDSAGTVLVVPAYAS